MIDFEKIGKRILEERKYLHRISQEKMAEDLGMYQADISNLEKAKNGSGITDLSKLDMIADYFDMPLETLLFGRRQDQMEKYYGSKMQLKESTKKLTAKHETILKNLMGLNNNSDMDNAVLKEVNAIECGPYMIYVVPECQFLYAGGSDGNNPQSCLNKAHIYVIYQDEVIGYMQASITTIMQHVFQPAFENLKKLIFPDIFDLDETLQTLNPYWLLYQYAANDEEASEFMDKMFKRMDELRATGENRIIFYIESSYVREDCRRNGIFRMMLDALKKMGDNAIIWLNLEPTSGSELSSGVFYHAIYEASELGQLNLNASIAEHLGFSIDPRTVDRQTERIDEDGNIVVETLPVRRIAYYLPKKIRNILNGDEEILAYARARKKVLGGDEPKGKIVDIFQGAWKKYGFIMAIKLVYNNETVYAFARGMDWKTRWLGVSKYNPATTGEYVETIEKYDSLKDSEESKYYPGLMLAEQLLGAIFFRTVDPKDVKLDIFS